MSNNSILTIKDFFSRHNGLQRSNRFTVSFYNLPPAINIVSPEDFKCAAVAMGSRAIDGIADNLAGYGPGRIVPRYQKFVGGVFLVFPMTNDNFIIDFFNRWFNLIHSGGRITGNYSAPYVTNFYDSVVYNSTMKVNMLDPNGNVNKTFTFYEVYPVENLPFELAMAKPNEFMTYQVLMNYREFTIT